MVGGVRREERGARRFVLKTAARGGYIKLPLELLAARCRRGRVWRIHAPKEGQLSRVRRQKSSPASLGVPWCAVRLSRGPSVSRGQCDS